MDSLPVNLNVIPMDGRKWLIVNDSVKYDVIISVSGDPLTLGWNRFYTREFFTLVREHLSPGGIFSMQLSSSGSYVDNQGSAMLSINWNTLAQVFTHVAVIPGNATTFLASDSPLSLDIPKLLQQKSLKTTYVHPDYLDLMRLTFDSDQLMERIKQEERRSNLDLHPRLFFSRLSGLESISGSHALLLTGILGALLFLWIFLFSRPLIKGMYVSGFSGAGIQIMLIMVMQSLYGFAYMLTPLMITLFMLGIVLGTQIWKPVLGSPSLVKLSLLLGCMALIAGLVVLVLNSGALSSNRFFGMVMLALLNMIPGLLVGSVYGMSALLPDRENGAELGRLFSADLAGAALGSFVPIVFLLPLIGVTFTFILFCGINIASGLYILIRSTKVKDNG
jgi:spermidine synthase